MRKLTMALVAVFALGAVSEAAAQTETGTATVTIPEVLQIRSVGDLVIGEGDFNFAESDASTASGTVEVQTRANVQHSVNVSGGSLAQGGTSLDLQVLSGADWVAMDTEVTVLSALPAGSQAGTVTFQTTANVATHAPGAYTGTITYTVIRD